MADLTLRFEDYIEDNFDRMLAEIRDFARTRTLPEKLSLEIGSNKGRFLWGLAQRNTQQFYLGLEIRVKYADQANRLYEREGITNAHVLRADANLAIPILVDDGQLDELFLLYPDPWWKERHRKRRIIQPDFLDLMTRKMRPGGKLWIRTDVGPLANDMRADLNAHPNFELTPFDDYPLEAFPKSERDIITANKGMPVQTLYYTFRP